MPFRKYRAITEFSKNDTRIFKEIYAARNKRKQPVFRVPEAIKSLNVQIYDPNDPGFPANLYAKRSGLIETSKREAEHPFLRAPTIQEHPLYHDTKCNLFEGKIPMSDGISQAANLIHAVVIEQLPHSVLDLACKANVGEEKVVDAILHGEKYDPTLEKLPRRFDPIIFWIAHPRVHGTPVIKKNNIILHNLFRHVCLAAIGNGAKPDDFKFDRDEPISALVSSNKYDLPFVLRFQPHLTVQSGTKPALWASDAVLEQLLSQPVPSCHPIDPIIDLNSDNLYNDDALISRKRFPLHLRTLLFTREQDQKYPWTKEQNAANAIAHVFGAAVAQATRLGTPEKLDLEQPVLVKGAQLVDGKFDFVAVQLNTLDIRPQNPIKNIVWVEKGCRLYRAKPFYEQLESVEDLNMDVFAKFAALNLA